MNCIIAIDLLPQLTATDLPKKCKVAGVTLPYPDLYKGAMLSHGILERLQQQKETLAEIPFSEKKMLLYDEEFARCDFRRRLAFEDYVAVAYAKSEGCILLANKGCLSRYALSKGVAVMSLKELENHCERRQRQLNRRKEQLRAYFADEEHRTEEEPMQQPIDDDVTF